jgi:hypothetical protein
MARQDTAGGSRKRLLFFISMALLGVFVICALFLQTGYVRKVSSMMQSLDLSSTNTNKRAARTNHPNTQVHLPDWRMTTDCSAYSRDCVLRQLNQHSYAEYPFRFELQYQGGYQWQESLPSGWNSSLQKHIPSFHTRTNERNITTRIDTSNTDKIQKCIVSAQTKTVDEQLTYLLQHTLKPRNETLNMISFTISDYSYAKDMMQDVFEMAHTIVGFDNAFFMVAMDVPTMELACLHGYPFLAWPQQQEFPNATTEKGSLLKANVANTKFEISYQLAKRRQSFLFFEMDVWFVKSPIPAIRQQTQDILFSGHQNNPEAANIGVYSVIANKASEEYLRICVEILQQAPNVHDQFIMQQVGWFLDAFHAGRPFEFDKNRFQEPLPKIPTFQHAATIGRFVPFQIQADERPVPSEDTFAIHTLCGTPLRNPHGKKQIAKELGAWYGAGNYYNGKDNRYLWLDGHTWNGFSMAMSWHGIGVWAAYHSYGYLKWTVAATVALARRTNRIWVMPKILNDAGVHFIWTVLDMSSVEELDVEVRETNFPANPKAWQSASVPFRPVARTAVAGNDGSIFAQLNADTAGDNNDVVAWNSSTYQTDKVSMLDAWFAIHTVIPELVRQMSDKVG